MIAIGIIVPLKNKEEQNTINPIIICLREIHSEVAVPPIKEKILTISYGTLLIVKSEVVKTRSI